jgi:uncharacterized protein YbjT (DUF2867 family)
MSVQRGVLVVGATGNVGRHVVAGLVEWEVPVAALVRDPSAARLPPAVTVVPGDLREPGELAARLGPVDAVSSSGRSAPRRARRRCWRRSDRGCGASCTCRR